MKWLSRLIMILFFMPLLGCSNGPTATDPMMEKPMMKQPMAGMLSGSGGHQATGSVVVKKSMNGNTQLVLSEIKVDQVPDGRVYLAKGGDFRNGVELGVLQQFSGTVAFDIPDGIDPAAYDSVVIWCEEFDVEIGRADLPKMAM